MNENEKLIELEQRAKSHSHQLDEIKDLFKDLQKKHDTEIRELRDEQKALITLANGVDKIANELCYIKEDVKELKNGQENLTGKVCILENKDALETKKAVDALKSSLLWLTLGGIATYLLGQLLPSIFI